VKIEPRAIRYKQSPLFEFRICTKERLPSEEEKRPIHYYYFAKFEPQIDALVYKAEDGCAGVIERIRQN